MYFLLSVWVGKSIIAVTRLIGNSGSALPGLIIERIYPDFIRKASKQLKDGSVLVTGTNGKTTTNKFLVGIVQSAGKNVITNRAGGNLSRGIASAFLDHLDWRGKLDSTVGLFEVDEAFIGQIAAQLRPKYILVLNLLRDQLDRYGELDRTAELIAQGFKHAHGIILNADDPLVAGLTAGVPTDKVQYFGASDSIRRQLPHDAELHEVSRSTRRKKTKSLSKILVLSQARDHGDKQQIELNYQGRTYKTSIKLPGVFNSYNALAATTGALVLGLGIDQVIAGIQQVEPAFGRSETIKIGEKTLQLLLVKNPAGFNQVIESFLSKKSHQSLLIAINDNFADGRDVSWLWDVDIERLASHQHRIMTSGIRGHDMALRLKYADQDSETVTDLSKALKSFIKELPKGQIGYVVPTYTAMLSLRRLLSRKTKLKKLWQEI